LSKISTSNKNYIKHLKLGDERGLKLHSKTLLKLASLLGWLESIKCRW